MIAPEMAERLARVGPGTPMGNLLRRYWYPIAGAPELDQDPVRPVRLLGEDLVLFRSQKGELGLVGPRCAHRALCLAYGIPQENGLRCAYHGWTYDTAGQVVDMPFEPACLPLRITAYRAQELGGLIFAYLGPEPAPLLPRWDPLVRTDATKRIEFTTLLCSWLQCVENIMDPVHVEHLHGHYNNYLRQRNGVETKLLPKRHVKMEFDVKRFGIYKRRLLEGQSEDTYEWQVGHPLLFPNILGLPTEDRMLLAYRVPIDAKFNGYIHQTNHPLYMGKASDNYRRAFDAVRQAFEAARAAARPGNSVGDMARAAQAVFANRGVDGHFMLHGRGLGDDLPALCQGTPADDRVLLEQGTAFILKPWAADTGASGYRFRMAVGDTCVVAATGARRLSAHPMELSEIAC